MRSFASSPGYPSRSHAFVSAGPYSSRFFFLLPFSRTCTKAVISSVRSSISFTVLAVLTRVRYTRLFIRSERGRSRNQSSARFRAASFSLLARSAWQVSPACCSYSARNRSSSLCTIIFEVFSLACANTTRASAHLPRIHRSSPLYFRK